MTSSSAVTLLESMSDLDDPEAPSQTLRHVETIRSRCEEQFPMRCPKCEHVYANFAEYALATTPVGPPMEFDEEFGIIDLANCACESTLSLLWEGPVADERRALREAIADDVRRTKAGSARILSAVRVTLRANTQNEPTREN